MIPATSLTAEEFHKRFHPGGNASRDVNSPNHPILSDIPGAATSCLVYRYTTLNNFIGDSTYPIPANDGFKSLREIQSLQAVVKQISPGNTVFSHMFVDPHDALILFGEEFMKEMREIQSDVKVQCYTC